MFTETLVLTRLISTSVLIFIIIDTGVAKIVIVWVDIFINVDTNIDICIDIVKINETDNASICKLVSFSLLLVLLQCIWKEIYHHLP